MTPVETITQKLHRPGDDGDPHLLSDDDLCFANRVETRWTLTTPERLRLIMGADLRVIVEDGIAELAIVAPSRRSIQR